MIKRHYQAFDILVSPRIGKQGFQWRIRCNQTVTGYGSGRILSSLSCRSTKNVFPVSGLLESVVTPKLLVIVTWPFNGERLASGSE